MTDFQFFIGSLIWLLFGLLNLLAVYDHPGYKRRIGIAVFLCGPIATGLAICSMIKEAFVKLRRLS